MNKSIASSPDVQRRIRQVRNAGVIGALGFLASIPSDIGSAVEARDFRQVVALYGWGYVPPEAIEQAAAPQVLNMLSLVALVGYVAAGFGVAYIYRLATALGLPRPDRSMGWTVATLYLPGVVLWRPWQGIREVMSLLRQRSAGESAGRKAVLGGPALAFAIAWLVAGWLGWMTLRLTLRMDPQDGQQFDTYMMIVMVTSVANAAASCVLAATLVRFFNDAIRLARAVGAGPPRPEFPA